MAPQGQRAFGTCPAIAVSTFLYLCSAAAAQESPSAVEYGGGAESAPLQQLAPHDNAAAGASETPAPPETAPPITAPPVGSPDAVSVDRSPAPILPDASSPATPPSSEPSTPIAEEPLPGIGNAGVLAMTQAGFAETTILAAIAANPTHFDVRPRELVALKNEGVSERVIETMLTTETVKKQTAALAAAETNSHHPEPSAQITSDEFSKLSVMIEQLAARQQAAAATNREPDPPAAVDRTPHAWIERTGERMEIAPTIAQVAFTDERDSTRMKTLQGIGSKALAFANPALGGITSTIGSLFGSDNEHRSAVWALAGTAATRELDPSPRFEIEFSNIPGVNPDAYEPTLVRLVPTTDNYRLVAAAKTEGAGSVARPSGPIIEELVDTQVTRSSRGRHRVTPAMPLDAGQYALVLRPIQKKERRRDRKNASLGELLGGGTSQILYLTWDFAVQHR